MAVIPFKPQPQARPAPRLVPMPEGRLDSADLFAGRRTVTIAHGEEVYTLTLTSKNKLILTK